MLKDEVINIHQYKNNLNEKIPVHVLAQTTALRELGAAVFCESKWGKFLELVLKLRSQETGEPDSRKH